MSRGRDGVYGSGRVLEIVRGACLQAVGRGGSEFVGGGRSPNVNIGKQVC